jgi:hypothetical protein
MNSNARHASGARQFDSQATLAGESWPAPVRRLPRYYVCGAEKVYRPSSARIRVPAVRAAAVLSPGAYELLPRLPHPPIPAHRLPRMRRHPRARCSPARPRSRGYTLECPLRAASAHRAGRCDRELSPSHAAGKLPLPSAARACRLRNHRAGRRVHHRPKPAAVR